MVISKDIRDIIMQYFRRSKPLVNGRNRHIMMPEFSSCKPSTDTAGSTQGYDAEQSSQAT